MWDLGTTQCVKQNATERKSVKTGLIAHGRYDDDTILLQGFFKTPMSDNRIHYFSFRVYLTLNIDMLR